MAPPLQIGQIQVSEIQVSETSVLRNASTGGLAAAGRVDLFLERAEADGTDDDVVAHHVARRAVEAERLGELHAFLEGGLYLVAGDVLLDPGHVEADFLGDRERA